MLRFTTGIGEFHLFQIFRLAQGQVETDILRGQSGWGVKLTTRLNPVSSLKMSGAIPLFPHTLHDVHRDRFTLPILQPVTSEIAVLSLFLQPTLMHNSITTCMSQYYPRHVSGPDKPILRRNNCTNTASGILALISGCTLHLLRAESALNRCSLQPLMRARIPDAVFVQLFLLRMGMSGPETCRG